ncbi:hypothetical protein K502DRAFT_323167 [Neoconidiobolus thromboides FSU 785]|nr:hypothetical protein K502DRAFT_323167 [Neoconidiobolus thromboides FSU 785]
MSDELTVDESVLINDHENGNGNESDPNSSKDSNILGLQDEIICIPYYLLYSYQY